MKISYKKYLVISLRIGEDIQRPYLLLVAVISPQER